MFISIIRFDIKKHSLDIAVIMIVTHVTYYITSTQKKVWYVCKYSREIQHSIKKLIFGYNFKFDQILQNYKPYNITAKLLSTVGTTITL